MRLKLTIAILTAVFALGFPTLLPTANGAASTVSLTQACFAGAIEGRFRWSGNDVQAKQQWLDLSTFDNKFEPGTYESEGPFEGRTATYTWLDLSPDTIYYFRITQELRLGGWEASGTFTATTTPCPNNGGIRLALENGTKARETLDALAQTLGPTTPAPGRVVGFSTKPVKDLADLTPPGGTVSGCNTGIIYAVLHVPAAPNATFSNFGRPGEWTIDTKKSPWNLTSPILLFSGLASISNGPVVRVPTLTFDLSYRSAPGVYEVRYGTGANAVEGKVTLTC